MVCRRFYFQLILRISLIGLSWLFFFLSIFYLPNPSIVIILVLLILYQVFLLIRYLNQINHKLENFFIAHLGGDVTTSFTREKKSSEFNRLYDYFEEINQKLEKARVENEIRNNYFKTLVDHAAVGLISFTPHGEVEFFNDAARKIFGVYVVKNLDRLNRFKEGFSEHLLTLEPNQQDLIPIIINGELIQLAIKKVQFKTGEKLLNLVSLQNIKPELEQKEVESWQRLIRVLTHEIFNSITPITSLVSSMTKMFRSKDNGQVKRPEDLTIQSVEKVVRGLEMVEGRGNGLIQFVQNYREVTRLPKPQFQLLNVKNLLQKIHLLYEEQLTEMKIDLSVDCHQSLFVQADIHLVEQVLINLVKNAIEAIEKIPEPVIRLSGQSIQDRILIEVEDNGNGIPAGVLEDIFVPFFTTKAKGSGIGLSLSRQIIRLHGGSLDVQSEPGKTVFRIKL